MRLTCFPTNTTGTPIARLELRHRRRARAEDRIRAAKATGLRNLPLHYAAQNQVWPELVQLALDLLALVLTGDARWREPKRLRPAAVLRRRLTRHHRPPPLSPSPHPTSTITPLPGAVEPGAHPTRQPGHQPAQVPKWASREAQKGPVNQLTDPHARLRLNAPAGSAVQSLGFPRSGAAVAMVRPGARRSAHGRQERSPDEWNSAQGYVNVQHPATTGRKL